MKFRKGLKVDEADWLILRDTYSLLDPSHDIPRSPRFAFSADPFLILSDEFRRRGLTAGLHRTDDGHKVWWLEWLRDGERVMMVSPESLQELLFYLEGALFERRRIVCKQPKAKR